MIGNTEISIKTNAKRKSRFISPTLDGIKDGLSRTVSLWNALWSDSKFAMWTNNGTSKSVLFRQVGSIYTNIFAGNMSENKW